MIPNDTLLCTQISVLSSHHQRSFKKIWEQVKKWPIARYYIVRESKLRGSIQFLLLGETVTTWKTVWKAFGSYKGWKTPGKHGPLNKLSRAFRDSQRLKQQSRDLQQSRQGMYVMVIILKIFVGLLSVEAGVSFTILTVVETILLLSGCLVQPQYEDFWFGLLYPVWPWLILLSWRPALFQRNRECVDLWEREMGVSYGE